MDFSKKIAEDQRLLLADLHRRIEAALQPFANDLDDFLGVLFQARLPADWRQQWHNFVAESATKGFFVNPKSVVELEEWIEAWARFCGLLPRGSGFGHAASPGIRTLLGGQLSERGEPILLASVAPGAQHSNPPKSASPKPAASSPSKPPGPVPPQPPAPAGKFNDDGVEVAGPGPETTAWYRIKVQKILETLAPPIGDWWKASSIRGVVRSRTAGVWQFEYYSHMEGKNQPVIVVDEDYTVGQTAAAIIAEVKRTLAADTIGACYRTYRLEHSGRPEGLLDWQVSAFKEAAQVTSQLAEMYVSGIATLTPVGDLVLFTTDVMQRGLTLDQLVNLLPLVGHLPIGAIIVKFGKRELKLPKALVKKLEAISERRRKGAFARASAAKTDDEAIAIIEHEIATADVPEHHIATSRNKKSTLRGGPWTPRFKKLFEKAGLTIEDVANKVRIPAHRGPHPEAYHQEIYRRLTDATRNKSGAAYKEALLDQLRIIGNEASISGTTLNRLLTE